MTIYDSTSACIMSLVGAVYRFRFLKNEANFTWTLLDVSLIK